MKRQVLIMKSTVEKVFSLEEKLKKPLQKSEANQEQIDFIITEIKSDFFSDISTNAICKLNKTLLCNSSRHLAKLFITKTLQELSRKRILQSIKGPNGGFFSEKKGLKTYSAYIVKAIDGDKIYDECVLRLNECSQIS